MKKLLLVRHAKSSWKDPSLPDAERPLNRRGERDAREMGKRLAQRSVRLDLIISSPAKRAIATAKRMAKELDSDKRIVEEEKLYDAGARQILAVIRSVDDEHDAIMLVAHNPGVTDLVNQISGERLDNIPTCGIVELTYAVEAWKEIALAKPVDFSFDYPKNV